MCVVSMVMDHYKDKYDGPDWDFWKNPYPSVAPDDIQKLRDDIKELKKLIKRAKKYDIDNNEPDCEIEDRVAHLRKIAEWVGVSLDDDLNKA